MPHVSTSRQMDKGTPYVHMNTILLQKAKEIPSFVKLGMNIENSAL